MRTKTFLVSLSLCLGLSSAALAETGVTDKEILIGTCNALSGPSAYVGKEMNLGFKTYINSVNAAGGVNGRKIKISSCDDRYEADGAATCFEQMMSDRVFGVTGCFGSALLMKYVPSAMANKVPFVGFYSGPVFVGEPIKRYVFGTRVDFPKEESLVVEKLWQQAGLRKFAVIYQNDSYGYNILEGVKSQLKKYGADVVATGNYKRNSNNLKDAFTAVKKANPEVVILACVHVPSAEVTKMAHDENWHPVFVMNSGSTVDAFITTAGKDAEGVLVTEVVPPPAQSNLPLIQQYKKQLKEYFPDQKPGFTSLRGYVNASLWVEALKRCGKDLTREKFVDNIEKIHDWDQGLGKDLELSYSPTNHLGRSSVFYGMIKQGDIVQFDDWKNLGPKVSAK